MNPTNGKTATLPPLPDGVAIVPPLADDPFQPEGEHGVRALPNGDLEVVPLTATPGETVEQALLPAAPPAIVAPAAPKLDELHVAADRKVPPGIETLAAEIRTAGKSPKTVTELWGLLALEMAKTRFLRAENEGLTLVAGAHARKLQALEAQVAQLAAGKPVVAPRPPATRPSLMDDRPVLGKPYARVNTCEHHPDRFVTLDLHGQCGECRKERSQGGNR